MLFYRIAAASPEVSAIADLLLVGCAATAAAIVAALALAVAGGLHPASRGTFMQGVFRGNLTFIGLPVVLYAFAGAAEASAAAEANALLAFGPMVVLYNVLAVLVLLLFAERRDSGVARELALGLLTNPILLACVAGLAFSLTGIALPTMVERSFAAVGQMALPLALICRGGTLCSTPLQGSLGWAVAGSLLKVGLVPGIGLLLAWWIGLSGDQTRIVLILLACPTASASYVLVRQMKGDTALAASMIVISNMLALPAMAVVLAITA